MSYLSGIHPMCLRFSRLHFQCCGTLLNREGSTVTNLTTAAHSSPPHGLESIERTRLTGGLGGTRAPNPRPGALVGDRLSDANGPHLSHLSEHSRPRQACRKRGS